MAIRMSPLRGLGLIVATVYQGLMPLATLRRSFGANYFLSRRDDLNPTNISHRNLYHASQTAQQYST